MQIFWVVCLAWRTVLKNIVCSVSIYFAFFFLNKTVPCLPQCRVLEREHGRLQHEAVELRTQTGKAVTASPKHEHVFSHPCVAWQLDYLGTVCLSCDAVFLNDSREAGSAAGNTDKGVFGAHCGHHGKGSVAQITPLVAQTCPDGWYGFMSSVSLERDP